MNIEIITYNKPHRKTQDLIYRLILNGHKHITLHLLPWEDRKVHKPLYPHRPKNKIDVPVPTMCSRLNINYLKFNSVNDLKEYFIDLNLRDACILIGGAGILPNSLVNNVWIINAHPGYLPEVKGLDAFKWAILKSQPIGVTTHYISDKVDEGQLIERTIVPIYYEDTYDKVARRVYETEIEMLAKAPTIIKNGEASFASLSVNDFRPYKRMPKSLEVIMKGKFEELRKNSKSRLF